MKWNRTIRVKWSVKRGFILGISLRKKTTFQGEEAEYAVLSVGTLSDFDEMEENPRSERVKVKFISLICFDVNIYSKLVSGECYSFAGKVGFGYGSTFFTIESVWQHGEDITKPEKTEEEGETPPSFIPQQEFLENLIDNLGYLSIRLIPPVRGIY
jgi:hypothetical protein